MSEARELIARVPVVHAGGVICGNMLADRILAALTAAGYRIIGPGQLDKETVERCAEVADECSITVPFSPGTAVGASIAAGQIAAAIRALSEQQA